MVPIPENLPLLVGQNLPSHQLAVVERILKGQTDLKTNLIDLGKHFKVRVWFDREIDIRIMPRWVNKQETENGYSKLYKQHVRASVHVFNYICTAAKDSQRLLYGTSKKARQGFDFPSLEFVTRYEPVIPAADADEFKSYEQFAAKFDRRFITETMIQDLWNSKSGQHGGKYKPSDFHRIGPKGKQVLENFLRWFVDVNDTVGQHYYQHDKYKCLNQRRDSYHHFGRDISISHTLGIPRVSYSSEYHGCGNGRYGLLANKNEFLWLEDD